MIINDIGRKAAIMAESGNSYQKIYEIVKQIPKGCVASYGQVAALAGNPRWARVVGYALHVNPDPAHIPCYRVVNREGRLSDAFAFGGVNEQKLLLEAANRAIDAAERIVADDGDCQKAMNLFN